MFNFKRGNNFAIDLGNNNTILSKVDSSLSQPTLIVLHTTDQTVKAVGKEAFDMLGKVQENYKVVRPLREGLIADFKSTNEMLRLMVSGAFPKSGLLSGFDHIIAGVPYASTEVERRALRDALVQFNASKTFLIFEPIAAAVGMGLDVFLPEGKLVVDIGGGITEAAVISFAGIVNHTSIITAGDSFDQDIQQYIKQAYRINIGTSTAEQVKVHLGAAMEMTEELPPSFSVVGKDASNNFPREITLEHAEIARALDHSISKIEQAILKTLEECPPELAGDIYKSGIHLTGGGSLLRGLRERIAAKVQIPVHQDAEALLSVAKGMILILKHPGKYRSLLFK
jgi:rod shape-determining protein MreB